MMTQTITFTMYNRDFLMNISEYYWIRHGVYNKQPWKAIGRLHNGDYFYYIQWIEYDGFKHNDKLQIWTAKTHEAVVEYGMDQDSINEYLMTC